MSTLPLQIGPYRIVRLLGEGGMGAVYEAIQEPIERRVALKVLLPQHAQNRDALTRFFNEARAVNLIEHPSIVQVSDYGQAPDGSAYLVMECLRGETLSSRLTTLKAAGRRLSMVESVQIAAQIADAVKAAHDKAIVHRDLKPGNVMLVPDPAVLGGERAKVLDFGIAKLTQGKAQGTATNALIGTPQYMSPEQCRGAGGVDGKTDVYALGVILYEMLAGRPPFLGESMIEYMGQHAFQIPPPLGEFARSAPPILIALVHRLLSKDKTLRPSMREVGTELSRMMSSLPEVKSAFAPPSEVYEVDNDATRRVVGILRAPSTLGDSLGQTVRPTRSMRQRIGLACVAVGLVLAFIFAISSRLSPHAPSRQTAGAVSPVLHDVPTAPLVVPVVPIKPPVQTPALPAQLNQGAAPPAAPSDQPLKGTAATTSPTTLTVKPQAPQPRPQLVSRPPPLPLPISDPTKENKSIPSAKPVPASLRTSKPSGELNSSGKVKNSDHPTPRRPVAYED